ncbi:MAG: sigma-70 family RNA polymerase sigma factor [Hyphomicrobiaceae bacterium]
MGTDPTHQLVASMKAAGLAMDSTAGHDDGDVDLLGAIAAEDREAFRMLVEAQIDRIAFAARRVLGDPDEALDVAQDTFLRLWEKAPDLAARRGQGIGDTNLGGWLRRVAVNLAIDRLRARRRLEEGGERAETAVAPTQLSAIAADQASEVVLTALAQLPDRQRVAITMFHFEDLSQREIAETLDLSEDAVESLLARGRRKLRTLLADTWRDLLDDEFRAGSETEISP